MISDDIFKIPEIPGNRSIRMRELQYDASILISLFELARVQSCLYGEIT